MRQMNSVCFSETQTKCHLLFRGETFTQTHIFYNKSTLRNTSNPSWAVILQEVWEDCKIVVYKGLVLISYYLCQDVKAIRLHTCCRAGPRSIQRNKQTRICSSGQDPVTSAHVWRQLLVQKILLSWINNNDTASQRQKSTSSDVGPCSAFTFAACNPRIYSVSQNQGILKGLV